MILAIQAKEHELCRNIINDYLLSASQNCSVGSAQDNFSQVLTSSKQDTFSSCTFSAENINPCLQVKTKNIDLLPDFINSSDLKLCSSQISSPASSSSPTTSLYYDQNEKDKRPHGCKECGKRFRFKSNLFEHKSLHQKTFPFMCPFCGKTCRKNAALMPLPVSKQSIDTYHKNFQ
uniref:C2H2-type domain-containing protein n=1 Tax=Ditylenchus dipsaci TaxID=166011 RepID=A0A915D1P0_9BILA